MFYSRYFIVPKKDGGLRPILDLRLLNLSVAVSTSRCRSRSYEIIGVKTKHQDKCAFSIAEDHLSVCGVGFDHDAGTYVPCSDRVDLHVSQESKRRPVTHCQAVSKITESDES